MTSEQRPEMRVELDRPYRPTEAGTFHLVTTVVAPAIDESKRSERPPLNLSFVVDRSGSMAGGKLDLARQGVEYALGLLNKRDTVSLVVYDDAIDLLMNQRKANRDARETTAAKLRDVHPRGSTALAEGWGAGCAQLAPIADEARRAICRTILLTDGLANVGETDPSILARDAGELATRGITTTTFGVGDQFDELLLAGMADAGRGRYHYIANSSGIVPVFAGELGELLHVTMRDARLTLAFPEGWVARILNDLPLERSRREVTVELGDIAAGDARPIVWEIDAPAAVNGSRDAIEINLRWTAPDGSRASAESRRQVIEAQVDPGLPNPAVQDRLAVMLGARARAEALEHNRAGRYDQAVRTLQAMSQAMPASPEGSHQAAELNAFLGDVAAPLSSSALKDHHFRSRRASRAQKDYSGSPDVSR